MGARKAAGAVLVSAGLAFALLGANEVATRGKAVSSYATLAEERAREDAGGGIDWDGLVAANQATCAWVEVPGAGIDLPVMQAADDDPDFWLAHDLWGEPSPAGTPYVDHRARAGSQHLLCYGHHLAGTGGMFSALRRCHEQACFDHTLAGGLVWSTPSGTARLEPLCASVVDMEDPRPQRFSFSGDTELRDWLSSVLADATARSPRAEAALAGARRAVTLVTCASELSGQRWRTAVTFVGLRERRE